MQVGCSRTERPRNFAGRTEHGRSTIRHFLTYGNKFTYCRGMGQHTPRTAADAFNEATAARQAASREMDNWRAHLAALEAAAPGDREGLAYPVRRSERIIAAQTALADERSREGYYLQVQLKSVS